LNLDDVLSAGEPTEEQRHVATDTHVLASKA
jgi:hypothetical protein